MPDGSQSLVARTVSSIHDIDAKAWDALANPSAKTFNPFVAHAFLSALEDSKSVTPENGWAPMHLVVEDGAAITGAAPLYAKGHSQGEYVFDHHWATPMRARAARIIQSFYAPRRSRPFRARVCWL